MKIVLVNPILSTPDVTPESLASLRVPRWVGDPRRLRDINIVELGSALAERGHEVTVVAAGDYLDGRTIVFPNRLTIASVHTFMRLPFHPGLLPMTPGLMGHPALLEAEVIQAGEFHQPSTFFAAKAARERPAGFIVWQETFERMRAPGSLYQDAYERTAGRVLRETARAFVPRTGKARDFLVRLGVREAVITPSIPTGIDVETFTPHKSRYRPEDFGWPAETKVLLAAGRLHPRKGIDLALQAFRHVVQKEPAARMIVAGDGPQRVALQKLAQDLGISRLVAFLGQRPRSDMIDLYRLADVVLCTSRKDLLPFTLIEASACARPCVAFDVGAVRDIVEHERTGLVVESQEPGAFAVAVLRILRDDGLRSRLGSQARQRMENHFDVRKTAERLIEVYDAART